MRGLFIHLFLVLQKSLDSHLLSRRLKTPSSSSPTNTSVKDHKKDQHKQARNFYLLQQSLQSRRTTFILPRYGFYAFTKSDSETKTTPIGNNGMCIQYKFAKHIKISFYNLFFFFFICSNQFSLLVCHSANCVAGKTEPERNLNIPAS